MTYRLPDPDKTSRQRKTMSLFSNAEPQTSARIHFLHVGIWSIFNLDRALSDSFTFYIKQ